MELKILEEDANELFNRKEIRFEVIHEDEPTPKLVDIRRLIAQKTNSMIIHVIIDDVETLFGIGRTIGEARVYANKDDLLSYEPKYLLKRNELIEVKEEGKVGEKEGIKEEGKEESKES